jgi:hypothetical protein
MVASIRARLEQLRVEETFLKYPELRLAPSHDGSVTLAGDLQFHVKGPTQEPIEDSYAVRLHVPTSFPNSLALAWETGGRIPRDYHKMGNESLCLGAPTEQRMIMTLSPTLLAFLEKLVIPYLFSYSFFKRYGTMPYDELSHGEEGILQYLASLFESPSTRGVKEFLRLAGMKKRRANKLPCPCGRKLRLGRCHHRRVNSLRDRMGRRWFGNEYTRLTVKT